MENPYHKEILHLIKKNSGKGTERTFLDSYLGNSHPRYAINAPALRSIARLWTYEHKSLDSAAFADLLTSLIEGKSSTEKCIAGMMMDYCTREQQTFDPTLFDHWLDQLKGWAEVDSICTGKYTIRQIPLQWKKWKPILIRFSKSKIIEKRRASLVLLCSPLRHSEIDAIAIMALENIDRLKSEKEVLITKAISWVLRSMIKHHRGLVEDYLKKNSSSLPSIAVRETMTVLKTGRKTKR